MVIVNIADKGNSAENIGLAAVCENPEGKLKRREPIDPRTHTNPGQNTSPHFAFTRLPRSLDWMGLDPTLKVLNGLRAIVFGNQLPHYVIAMTDEQWKDIPPTDSPFPMGQASILQEILEWHGATTIWMDQWRIVQ